MHADTEPREARCSDTHRSEGSPPEGKCPAPPLVGVTAGAAEPAAGRGEPTAGARHEAGGARKWRRGRSIPPTPGSGGPWCVLRDASAGLGRSMVRAPRCQRRMSGCGCRGAGGRCWGSGGTLPGVGSPDGCIGNHGREAPSRATVLAKESNRRETRRSAAGSSTAKTLGFERQRVDSVCREPPKSTGCTVKKSPNQRFFSPTNFYSKKA